MDDAAEQPQLPLEWPSPTPSAGIRTRLRAAAWLRLHAARDVLVHQPRRACLLIVAFLMRWGLRIALPLAGAGVMLHLFPYRAVAGGVHFRVEGTVFTRPGLTADTTFGNWEFPHVDGLPVGAHISPENVDVVRLATAAKSGGAGYADHLRADFSAQVPRILVWLVGEAVLGILAGIAVAVCINLAVRYVRRMPRRAGELRYRGMQAGVLAVVAAVVIGYGLLSYNPDWAKRSRLTGTLAALQLFPDQLRDYYAQSSKAVDVVNAIAAIQEQLQTNLDQTAAPETAFNIMFISDMHLAGTYPLVAQYAKNFGVKLIVNTGDESEFGTEPELTPTYLKQMREVTAIAPMIWLAGNHDSPDTVATMRTVPNVIVLGTKDEQGTDYVVGAEQLDIDGLTIAAVPDPRVYGGAGDYGSNDASVVHALEQRAVDGAVHGTPKSSYFDIFATHEPVAADRLRADLPGQIRQTNAGHEHKQNNDLQNGGVITLVEGSTGAGGLDAINTGTPPPPIEFSIESVATDCQFTKLVRFQLTGPPPTSDTDVTNGQRQVSASTTYFDPQQIRPDRVCAAPTAASDIQPVG